MRSSREIFFRLRQEVANAALYLFPPNRRLREGTPLPLLPSPDSIAERVKGTPYAQELVTIADRILSGTVPLLGTEIQYGHDIPWRRDVVAGKETPPDYFRRIPYLDAGIAGDHKLIWEINRHQHLVLLAQAYVISKERKYFDEVARQLESWWKDNPPQRGINWASALEIAFRALSWTWLWHLAGAGMDDGFRHRFLNALYQHGLYLEYNLSFYFSPNTHLLGEAVALHAIGRLFPALPRAATWRALGREVVREHMASKVKADGSYYEQSTYYHMYALDFFLLHAVLEDMTEPYRDGLRRMAEFLSAIVAPDGRLAFFGDDDGGRVFHPFGDRAGFARGTLAVATQVLGTSFGPFADQDTQQVALWWLGPQVMNACSAQQKLVASRAFSNSGMVAMRRGDAVVLFDAGPFGPGNGGHSHADTLSLVAWNGSEEVLIDPGTYSYMDPEWRDKFRGTAAHSTVTIDRLNQALSPGPFRWTDKPEVELLEFTSGDSFDRAIAVCRYRGFTHTRTVVLGGEGQLEVTDEISGPAGEHTVEQRWHVAREPQADASGTWRIGEVAELFMEGGAVEQGWRSSAFGTKQAAPVIVVRRRSSLPATLTARLRLGSKTKVEASSGEH